jgi:hypothetical protein
MYSIACTLPTGNKNEERVIPSPKGGKKDKGRKRKRDKREEGIKKRCVGDTSFLTCFVMKNLREC